MNDSDLPPRNPAPPEVPPTPAPVPASPTLDPLAALAALASPVRWSIFKMLATGQELSASMVASALKRDFDGVCKHLRVMRDARVIAWRFGEDKRFILHYIPAANRPEPGVVDLGFCRLRLPRA